MRLLAALCCCCCGQEESKLRPIRSNVVDWRAHPIIQQYQLLEHIGEGGFSEVWLAKHHVTGERAALKVVYLNKPGLCKEEAAVLESEAKYLRLLDHPNILHCRAVLETKYDLVLVLEYLSGGELLDHLHSVQHMDEGQAAQLFNQVVSAVAYMHGLNILHRDIKPENVMFARPVQWYQARNQSPQVKVIDLGMALVYRPEGDNPQGCLGSPGFIAPEVVRGGEHTPAMDMYALGALLYVMLTGRKVWELRDVRSMAYAQHKLKDAPGLQDPRFLACSPAARELVIWMMADKPTARPTANQVLDHAWSRGRTLGGRRLVIDPVVRRRMLQLANLRRYKGLAFALMMNSDQDMTAGSIDRVSASSLVSSAHSAHSLASLGGVETPSNAITPSRRHFWQADSIRSQASARHREMVDGVTSRSFKHQKSGLSDREHPRHGSEGDSLLGVHYHRSEADIFSRRSFSGAPWYVHAARCEEAPHASGPSRLRQHSSVSAAQPRVDSSGTQDAKVGGPLPLSVLGQLRQSHHRRSHSATSAQPGHGIPMSCQDGADGRCYELSMASDTERRVKKPPPIAIAATAAHDATQECTGSFIRRAPQSLLTAIQLQRKLMHQDIKSRARARQKAVEQPPNEVDDSLQTQPQPADTCTEGGTEAAGAVGGQAESLFALLGRKLSQALGMGGKAEATVEEVEEVPLLSQQAAVAGGSGAPAARKSGPGAFSGHGGAEGRPSTGGRGLCTLPETAPLRVTPGQDLGTLVQTSAGEIQLERCLNLGPRLLSALLVDSTLPGDNTVHPSANEVFVCNHDVLNPGLASSTPGSATVTRTATIGSMQASPGRAFSNTPRASDGIQPALNSSTVCTKAPLSIPSIIKDVSTGKSRGLRIANSFARAEGARMDVALVATALFAAPQLTRSWTAPEHDSLPNVLANAIGMAAPRGQHWDIEEQMRAMSLNPLALAFLDGEAQLRDLLGESAAGLALGDTSGPTLSTHRSTRRPAHVALAQAGLPVNGSAMSAQYGGQMAGVVGLDVNGGVLGCAAGQWCSGDGAGGYGIDEDMQCLLGAATSSNDLSGNPYIQCLLTAASSLMPLPTHVPPSILVPQVTPYWPMDQTSPAGTGDGTDGSRDGAGGVRSMAGDACGSTAVESDQGVCRSSLVQSMRGQRRASSSTDAERAGTSSVAVRAAQEDGGNTSGAGMGSSGGAATVGSEGGHMGPGATQADSMGGSDAAGHMTGSFAIANACRISRGSGSGDDNGGKSSVRCESGLEGMSPADAGQALQTCPPATDAAAKTHFTVAKTLPTSVALPAGQADRTLVRQQGDLNDSVGARPAAGVAKAAGARPARSPARAKGTRPAAPRLPHPRSAFFDQSSLPFPAPFQQSSGEVLQHQQHQQQADSSKVPSVPLSDLRPGTT